MSTKLTDKQLAVLTAASLRDDRCLMLPKILRGGAAQKVASKLSAAGLVKEVIAKVGMPVWRRDEEAGRSYSIKLTAVGLKAAPAESSPPLAVAGADEMPLADKVAADPVVAAVTPPADTTATGTNPPRDGTKIAKVLGLLRSSDGAALAEMIAATGWLPHTTRGALTGLRKRGYDVTIDRSDKARGSVYHVIVDAKSGGTAVEPGRPASGSILIVKVGPVVTPKLSVIANWLLRFWHLDARAIGFLFNEDERRPFVWQADINLD
jgi:hypothetical protein